MKNWDDIYKKFKQNFSSEALTKDESRGFTLTSIKAQYIVERLNDTVGVNNWEFTGKFEKTTDGVLFFGNLTIYGKGTEEERSTKEGEGFSKNKKNTGDTYKSARTDALSKAASYFGIGNEVFKGNVDVDRLTQEDEKKRSREELINKAVAEINDAKPDQY